MNKYLIYGKIRADDDIAIEAMAKIGVSEGDLV